MLIKLANEFEIAGPFISTFTLGKSQKLSSWLSWFSESDSNMASIKFWDKVVGCKGFLLLGAFLTIESSLSGSSLTSICKLGKSSPNRNTDSLPHYIPQTQTFASTFLFPGLSNQPKAGQTKED